MASGKETPRQKMIGLMYLVLMAMLALNVSKDILESFVQVNTSLENSMLISKSKNDALYAQFALDHQLDPKRVKPFFNNATIARQKTEELLVYIEELKRELIKTTDNLTDEQADTTELGEVLAKDNFDVPTQIMIGLSEDGSAGKSAELRAKIEAFRAQLMELVPEEERESIDLGLELKGSVKDGEELNWEMTTFDHTTLAATIVNLSKLQNDVRNAEYDVMNRLHAQVGSTDLVFDTVAPKIVAPTNYVLLGEEYKADIFLAAFNKTKDPVVTIDGAAIPVQRGLGQYAFKTNKQGTFTYQGEIAVETTKGEKKIYPFESSYIVARPSATISPTAMNVMYVGVDNPLSVSVPGVANENVSVKASGGAKIKRTGDGVYSVSLPKNAKGTVNITATAKMADGISKSMGQMAFRVKRIPPPITKIQGKTASGSITKGVLKQMKKVGCIHKDFLFDVHSTVTSFTAVISLKGSSAVEFPCKGNKLSTEAKKAIKRMRKGDRIFFEDVRVKMIDGTTKKIPGISFKVQ